jgi:hypothetical protein
MKTYEKSFFKLAKISISKRIKNAGVSRATIHLSAIRAYNWAPLAHIADD